MKVYIGVTDIAAELRVHPHTVRTWLATFADDPDRACPPAEIVVSGTYGWPPASLPVWKRWHENYKATRNNNKVRWDGGVRVR